MHQFRDFFKDTGHDFLARGVVDQIFHALSVSDFEFLLGSPKHPKYCQEYCARN